MNKKNEDLNKEQKNLIKQDIEMWTAALSAQDYKVECTSNDNVLPFGVITRKNPTVTSRLPSRFR